MAVAILHVHQLRIMGLWRVSELCAGDHPLGRVLCKEFGLDPGTRPDARLVEDLGFDSMLALELQALFGEAGIDLPEELFQELRTLQDVFHYFDVGNGRLEPR